MVWGVLPQKGLRHLVVDILTSDTPDVLDLFNLKGLTTIFNPILGCLSLEGPLISVVITHCVSGLKVGDISYVPKYSLDKQHVPFLSDVQNLVEGTSWGIYLNAGFVTSSFGALFA